MINDTTRRYKWTLRKDRIEPRNLSDAADSLDNVRTYRDEEFTQVPTIECKHCAKIHAENGTQG
jgi:hypothetical protein